MMILNAVSVADARMCEIGCTAVEVSADDAVDLSATRASHDTDAVGQDLIYLR